MKSDEIQFARNLEALKAPQCRRIIQAIYSRPLTIAELVTLCKLTQGSITKHLEVLADAGLIDMAGRPNAPTYALNANAFSETEDWFKALGN